MKRYKGILHEILKRCNKPKMSYTERLDLLKLETLERRRVRTDLSLCYKIRNNLIDLDSNQFFEIRDGITRGHSAKLIVKKSRINARKFFFANRVVNQWNSLTEEQIAARSFGAFKRNLTVKNFKLRFG